MLSSFYNYFIIFFLLFFSIHKLTLKYFGFSKNEFYITFFYHFLITLIYLILFKNHPADFKHYLELKHMKPFEITSAFASTEIVYNFINLFKNLFYFNNFNIIFLFSIISYFGILIFIKNLIKIGVDKKIAFLIFFIPGIHFWTSLPGKDGFVLLFLSCFFYMYINKKVSFSIIFIFFVVLIRPQIGLIFLISLGLTEFISAKKSKKILILIASLVGLYLILNSTITSGYLISKNIFSDNLFIQMLAQINELSLKFSDSDSSYNVNNLFFNILNYLIFPVDFIYKQNSLIINFSILLEILSLIFLINLLINHNKEVIFNKKIIYFLSFTVLIYLMILPQALFNFGINSRQKWMIIPFIIYLSFLLKYLFVKTNKI